MNRLFLPRIHNLAARYPRAKVFAESRPPGPPFPAAASPLKPPDDEMKHTIPNVFTGGCRFLAEMMGQILNLRCTHRRRETWARREMQSFSHLLPHRAPTTRMGHPEKRFYANRLAIYLSPRMRPRVTTIQAEHVIGLACPSEHFRLGSSSHKGENKTTHT